MKKLILIASLLISQIANAQLIQQHGNGVYITQQSGAMDRFYFHGNQITHLPAQTFTPTPLNTQIVPMGQPQPTYNFDFMTSSSGIPATTGAYVVLPRTNNDVAVEVVTKALACPTLLFLAPLTFLFDASYASKQLSSACTLD